MSDELTSDERRELESLREWRTMVRHAPDGAQDVVRARMLASEALQPIVQAWRCRVQVLEEALEPLAARNVLLSDDTPDTCFAFYAEGAFRGNVSGPADLTAGDVRRARAALAKGAAHA